jgi:hypothetical protein
MITDELVKTDRREAREKFAIFLMEKEGYSEADIRTFLDTKQAVLEDRSPTELIYGGELDRGMRAVYTLLDGLTDDDNES